MLIALDVAILPPPPVTRRAIELSAALPAAESQGLRLGAEMLPHITLTQQFVRADELDAVLDRVAAAIAGFDPLRLTVPGAGRSRSVVWMAIDPTPRLNDLHRGLMDALREFERDGGTPAAFVDGGGRPGDVEWVANFRRTAGYASFDPHVTLGHASALPGVERQTFDAATIAACHLGKFCTCRQVLRRWEL